MSAQEPETPQPAPSPPPAFLLGRRRRTHRPWVAALLASAAAMIAAIVAVTFVRVDPPHAAIVVQDGARTVQIVEQPERSGPWPMVAFAPAFVIGVVGALALKMRRRMRDTSPLLGATVELSNAGPIAEALWHSDPYVRTEAEEALITLLPRLRAGDGGLLNMTQRACLHRALQMPRRRREADLVVAIIGALTEIGDERAIPHIDRLAESTVRGALQEQVRAYAAQQAPLIRSRVELARAAQTLVRPASATPADTLVRPAQSAPSGPVEQLVRPAPPPEA